MFSGFLRTGTLKKVRRYRDVFAPLDVIRALVMRFDFTVDAHFVIQAASGIDDGGAELPFPVDFDFLDQVDGSETESKARRGMA